MIKNVLKFDTCNMEACRKLSRELKNVIDLWDDVEHLSHNEEDIQKLAGQRLFKTDIDTFHAEQVFTSMFNELISQYIDSQGKEES